MESQAKPILVMSESIEDTARRQCFQAGFHSALFLMEKLPEAHFRKIQAQLPEWGHVVSQPDETL